MEGAEVNHVSALFEEIGRVARERIHRAGLTQRKLVPLLQDEIPGLTETNLARALDRGLTRPLARALDRRITKPSDHPTFEEYRDQVAVARDRDERSALPDAPALTRESPLDGVKLHYSFFQVRSGRDARNVLTAVLSDLTPEVPQFSLYSMTGRFDLVARYWTTLDAGTEGMDESIHRRLLDTLAQAALMEPESDAESSGGRSLTDLFAQHLFVEVARFASVDASGELADTISDQLSHPSTGSTNRQLFDSRYAERRGLHREILILEMPHPDRLWPGSHEVLYRELEHKYGSLIEAVSVNQPSVKDKERGYIVLELLNTCAQHGHIHDLHRELSTLLKQSSGQQTTLNVFDIVESELIPVDSF